MASITSLMNSTNSSSSLYGNRNIISGLASGMDTEAMIENSISGYKTKITSLQQKMTKLQWKQDAYRGLIASMNSILNKYTSYTSSTNLFSASFFNKAVNAVANGANASKVSVTGKGTSDVQIDRIKQLAQAASYKVNTSGLAAKGAATEAVTWNDPIDVSGVSGSMTIQYGGGADSSKGTSLTIRFSEDQVFNTKQDMVNAINEQLKGKQINGKSADNYIEAEVKDDQIVLTDKAHNSFKLTSVSGDLEKVFEVPEGESSTIIASKSSFNDADLVTSKTRNEYLADQSLSFTVDGKTKNIKLDFLDEKNVNSVEDFATALQEKLNEEFGSGKVYVQAQDGKLQFGTKMEDGTLSTPIGSTLKVGGNNNVNKALGLGEGGYSNTLQTGWKVSRVLGDNFEFNEYATNKDGELIDANGKVVETEAEAAKVATLTINGKDIQIGENDTIQNMMDKINSSDAGVDIKYSSLTGQFSLTAKETGADSKIEISGDLGKALFGDMTTEENRKNYKEGKDAEFTVTVNGEQMELTRSSNTVDLDGYKVTLKGAFGYNADGSIDNTAEAITFQTNTDSDKIVDAIKSFVEDYNKLVTELRGAYTTEPLTNSKKEEYQPLTEDDQAKMSETAIKNYEEKAKTGLLYADSDLSNLYSKLTSAVQGNGEVSAALRSIGLKVNYSSGLSTLELDEDALRSALDSDPDRVKNAFTQTTSSGASANGLMYNIKNTMEMYANTSIGSPGILVKKAGTTLSSYSLNNNELNDQINNLQEQIEKWQAKMSDRVDFYTNQFTQLELLINKMNSQSSMLAGLSGGM